MLLGGVLLTPVAALAAMTRLALALLLCASAALGLGFGVHTVPDRSLRLLAGNRRPEQRRNDDREAGNTCRHQRDSDERGCDVSAASHARRLSTSRDRLYALSAGRARACAPSRWAWTHAAV